MSNKLGEGADHLSALLEASLKENGDENRALASQQPRAQVGGSDEDQQDRPTEGFSVGTRSPAVEGPRSYLGCTLRS